MAPSVSIEHLCENPNDPIVHIPESKRKPTSLQFQARYFTEQILPCGMN